MKDQRFLPVEKREPVDDYAEEADSDSLFIGSQADADELGQSKDGKKVMKDTLYIAS